jgi:DNA-directed RNA polymerase omega subunit
VHTYSFLSAADLDRLAEKVGGRYRLTHLVSQRLRQINAGAPLLLERREEEHLLATVCREVDEGLVFLESEDLPAEAEGESELDLFGFDEEGGED